MLKIKKRMLQAFALFFSIFFIVAPILESSQAYAAVCGVDLYNGNSTFCSAGSHTEQKVNYSCSDILSSCYIVTPVAPASCDWSLTKSGNPQFCWSFKPTGGIDSAKSLINGSVVNFKCMNPSLNLADANSCGGIFEHWRDGGQTITPSSIGFAPDEYFIDKDGSSLARCMVINDYNPTDISNFIKQQISRTCTAEAIGMMTTGAITIGAAGVATTLSAGALVGTVGIAGALTAAQASVVKDCLSSLQGNPSLSVNWNGAVINQSGKTVCETQIKLNFSVKDGVKSAELITPEKEGAFDLCGQIPDATQKSACYECAGPIPNEPKAIWTAVGCIPTTQDGIVSSLVKLGLGIAGTAALLMILAGGFMLSISQGDTKRVGEAKELVTSAVIGLVFIIFSVTLLQFIGVTIFHIPGF